jgi:hypothetical protein
VEARSQIILAGRGEKFIISARTFFATAHISACRSAILKSVLGATRTGNEMDESQLRVVTVRIAHTQDGGLRAWSDDLPGLNVTYPNHQVLFAELNPKIASLLKQQGFDSKVVREIHQFIVEVQPV